MTDDVRTVIERVGELFNSRQLDGLDGLVHEEMVNHAAGPQGRSGWKQVWTAIFTCFPDAIATTHALLVDGDNAAAHVSVAGTHQASVMPLLADIQPTGKYVTWEFIHLFRVADGLIVEHAAVRDDLGLRRQLGANRQDE